MSYSPGNGKWNIQVLVTKLICSGSNDTAIGDDEIPVTGVGNPKVAGDGRLADHGGVRGESAEEGFGVSFVDRNPISLGNDLWLEVEAGTCAGSGERKTVKQDAGNVGLNGKAAGQVSRGGRSKGDGEFVRFPGAEGGRWESCLL